jgi:hypothetical protein
MNRNRNGETWKMEVKWVHVPPYWVKLTGSIYVHLTLLVRGPASLY